MSNVSTTSSYPIEETQTERYVEAVILSLINVVAVVGNIGLYAVVLRDRNLRTPANSLILCLSSADILVSCINMPITVYTLVVGEWRFTDAVCVFSGCLNMLTFVGSVMSLGAIAISRYHLVCRPGLFKRLYTLRNALLIVAGVWTITMLLALPPLVGWAEYGYLPNQSFCFCLWKTSISYTWFMVIMCFGGPCSTMTFCYFQILRTFRRSVKRMKAYRMVRSNSDLGPKRKSSSCPVAREETSDVRPDLDSGDTDVSELPDSRDSPTCKSGITLSSDGSTKTNKSPVKLTEALTHSHNGVKQTTFPVCISAPDSKDDGNTGGNGNLSPREIEVYDRTPRPGKPRNRGLDPSIRSAPESGQLSTGNKMESEVKLKQSTPKVVICDNKPDSSPSTEKRKLGRPEGYVKSEERRLTTSLLVVVIVFIICWLPFCVTMFWSVYSTGLIPRAPDMASLLLGYCNSGCNPIIYGIMNRRFRAGFKNLGRRICCFWKPLEDLPSLRSQTSQSRP